MGLFVAEVFAERFWFMFNGPRFRLKSGRVDGAIMDYAEYAKGVCSRPARDVILPRRERSLRARQTPLFCSQRDLKPAVLLICLPCVSRGRVNFCMRSSLANAAKRPRTLSSAK